MMKYLSALAALLLLTAVAGKAQAAPTPPGLSTAGPEGTVFASGGAFAEAGEEMLIAKQVRSRSFQRQGRNQQRLGNRVQTQRQYGPNRQPLFKDRNRGVTGPQRVQPR